MASNLEAMASKWKLCRFFGQVTLLSQYQEDFSSYTLKQFLDDYTKAFAQAVGFAVAFSL